MRARRAALAGLALAASVVPAAAAPGAEAAALPAEAAAGALAAVAAEAAASPAGRAETAMAGMAAAEARLAAARAAGGGAGLARAVRGLEAALAALREGIAGADEEVRVVERALRREETEIKRLVAVLLAARRDREVPRLHPDGPVAAARAAILLEHVEAGLRTEAEALAGRFAALAAARRLRQDGEKRLAEGLVLAAAARTELRLAMAAPEGPGAPPDPEGAAAALVAGSETLSELAAALAGRAPAVPTPLVPPEGTLVVAEAAGDGVQVTKSTRSLGGESGLRLEAPVAGRMLRGFREPDAGGVRRPGLTLAAAPRAVVTAPVTGEVRYAGPFLDYNRVVVLAPEPGTVVVLAGLAELAVAEGLRVEAGATLGFLGGRELDAQEFLMLPGKGSDALGAETLYMELWRAGSPVDPGPWLDARNE